MNNKLNNFKDSQLGRRKKDIINKHHPALANKNFMDDRFMSRSSYVDEPVETEGTPVGLGYVFEDEVEAARGVATALGVAGLRVMLCGVGEVDPATTVVTGVRSTAQ